MAIHQIQIRYDELEDRLLLRVSTTEGFEYRFWMTRRFVEQLWGMLVKILEWDEAVRQQFDEEMRRSVLEIQHEGYAQQADYSKTFVGAPHLPLGPAPVLLARAKGRKVGDGLQMISLHPQQGQGIDMTLDAKLLHIFVSLLRQTAAKARWEMDLRLHQGGNPSTPAPQAPRRKLN